MKQIFLLLACAVSAFGFAQAPSNGLLHYYSFDNTLANGTNTHTLASNGGSYTNDRFGNTNRARQNPDNTSAIPGLPTASASPRSFSFWYQSNGNVDHGLLSYGNGAAYFGVYYLTTPSPRIAVVSGTGSTPIGQLTPISHNITYTGNWTHVTVVYTGTQVLLYLNGTSVATANFGLFNMTNTTAQIGRFASGALANGFKIDDLFFYNRALTAQEVTTLFEFCNAPGSTTPPANLSVCSGNTTTLSTTTASTTWYDAQTGGNVVGTGSPFTTPVLNSNTTFWAQGGTCPLRLGFPVTVTTVNAPVNTTTTANQNIVCGATTTLTATGSNLQWFDNPTGGMMVGTGGNFTTPALTFNFTYYVQASSGTCVSARTPITVNVTNAAPTAVNSNVTICYIVGNNNQAQLQVTAGPGTVNWFSQASGGSSLGTGNSFITPTLPNPSPNPSTTVTYYAERTTTCGVSARTPITVTVRQRPAAPTSTTPSANLNICSGSSTVLSVATTPLALEWYEVGQFPQPISTSNTYTTTVLNQTTSYEVYTIENGCSSVPPLTLTVNVSPPSLFPPTNTTPTANLSVCVGTPTTLSASGSDTVYWFNVPTGGNPLGSGNTFNTPPITANTNYYVQSGIGNCASPRLLISVTAIQPPAAPVSNTPAANLSICQGSGTTLSVTAPPANTTTAWWSSQTAITSFATGNSVTIPTDSFPATRSYWVSHINANNGCASARTQITVTVSTTPAAPTNTTPSANLTLCAGQTTSLSVSGTGTLEWFDLPTGGNILSTGANFTTPVLQSSITYYVSAKSGNCASTRTPVTVQVNALPNGPTNTTPTANLTRCAGQTTTLTASSGVANATINWYDVATSGTSLGTGGTFNTPALNTNTTYYVAVKFNATGCESARVAIAVTVNPIPTAAIAPATVTICNGASATLTASGGGTYAWSNSGGSNAAATFSPTTTTTYTVTVTQNGCSATASRQVTVNANPTAAITPANPAICNGASQTLTASGGTQYAWSNSLGTGASKSVSPTTTTTYTVTVTNAANCTATASATVTVNTVTAAINGPTTICSGLQATLTASGGTTYAWSNSGGTGAQATFTPTQTTTYTVTVTGAGNCTATASQTVSVQSAPTATIAGPTEVCAGSSVTLTANGGNTYTWANGLGSNAAITVSPNQTNTYTVTVSIGANCTASATQTVTVKQPTSSSFSVEICNGESYVFNNQTLSQSGVYTKTEVNSAGCDSVVTLNLTVLAPITTTLNESICSNSSYSFNGQQLTQAGQYLDTLQSQAGCDSIVTLNLSINQAAQITAQPTASQSSVCAGETVTLSVTATGGNLNYQWKENNNNEGPDAASYTTGSLTAGTKTYTVEVSNSCGSETSNTVTVTVNTLPQPTITQNGNVLSTQSFNSYQWQLNGSDINGAELQSYTTAQNGSYTVVVTDANGCSNTSAAVNVFTVGIRDMEDFKSMIYPNPASVDLTVETTEQMEEIQISDVTGRITVTQSNIQNLTSKIDLSGLAEATYFIHIKTISGKTAVKSFVKQ